MNDFYSKIASLIKRLGFMFLLYVLMRILMYVFNQDLYSNMSFSQWLSANFYGFRFDLSAVMYSNSLLVTLYLIPFNFTFSKAYNKLLTILFVVVNSLAVIANLSDIIYIRFTLKRTTAEVFSMFGNDKEILGLLPQFIGDFWYIALIGLCFVFLIVWFTKRTNFKRMRQERRFIVLSWKAFILSLLVFVLSIIGYRGGTQLRPISILTAANYADNNHVSLVLNTPFTILRTIGKTEVKQYDFFEVDELKSLINPIHQPDSGGDFRPLNVVVIVMESMSKEHSAYLNPNLQGEGFTPFLDSLMQEAFVCTQAYANGKRSIDGVPAILASFPSLFNDAFISTPYSSNKINSLASLLKQKNYSTAFFHGGNNGTMGFDNFVASIGYQNYYGREEYNNDNDFDGKWGIFDHKYFTYFEESISQMPQPFHATLFSLSAHHPYTLPEGFEGRFPEGKLPIQQCVAYSDYALQQFFKKASTKDWFNQTLFVITADHTSEIADKTYNNIAGYYAIPVVYYMPSDSLQGVCHSTTQQIDIVPSVLDYLQFDNPFYSLGNSVFADSNNREAISYSNGIYQYISADKMLFFDAGTGEVKDRSPATGILEGVSTEDVDMLDLETRFKALIQKYNSDLASDRMNVEKSVLKQTKH